MERKFASGIILTLFLAGTLLTSFEMNETSASPTVRIYVGMPAQGYIPGIPVGQILKVAVYIESPLEWENTADGIVGWRLYVHVDPEVLEPMTVTGAASGYFLNDFASEHGYWTAILFVTDKNAGTFIDIAEFIMGGEGVGAGGDGKLCELWFKSKSQTAFTPIDIYGCPDGFNEPEYWTPDGVRHPCDIVEDGYYNAPPETELPATIDIDPDTLNLMSRGKWITAYVQLPEDYNPEDIDASTILLNGTIQPVLDPKYGFVTNSNEYLVDHDNDGTLERMVKFDRAMVQSFIYDQGIGYGNVALAIAGDLLDGTAFEGTDVISVNYAGDANHDGTVNVFDICVVKAYWGTDYPDTDFNKDSTTNTFDILILKANWNQATP